MAKRQSIYVINSPDIQGEGSWIKVKRVEYGEAKKVNRQLRLMKREKEQAAAGAGNGRSEDEVQDALTAYNDAWIAEHLLDWNWVDDEGVPLPAPSKDPTVLDRLDVQEMAFIDEVLTGERDQKKS
jgi:hypothetical protein